MTYIAEIKAAYLTVKDLEIIKKAFKKINADITLELKDIYEYSDNSRAYKPCDTFLNHQNHRLNCLS